MAGADTYKPLKFFRDHTDEINTGFVPFSVGETHYFAYYFGRKLILISQGYKTIPGRDNGIESVKTNMRVKAHYKYYQDADTGKYYFDLIAGNYQGVARSAWFGSEAVARAMSNILIDETGPKSQDLEIYHPEAFFRAHATAISDGFATFQAKDGHYFTYNQNGKIILMSTAKPTAQARDTAIDKVRAHMKHEEWYEYRTIDTYQHDFRLVDEDEKEIARSVVFGSEEIADQVSLKLQDKPAEIVNEPAPIMVAEAPVEKAPVAPKTAASSHKELSVEQGVLERVFKWAVVLLFAVFMAWSFRSYFVGNPITSSTASSSGQGSAEDIAITGPDIVCWDKSRVANKSECPPEAFTLNPTITPDPETAYLCGDGSVVRTAEECPIPN